MRLATRRVSVVGTIAIAVAVASPGAFARGPGPLPTCAQPTSPTASARTAPDGEQLPPVDADPVSIPIVRGGDLDTDGDGVADDAALTDDGTVIITRSDGDVALTGQDSFELSGVGDLDGDGRDEVGVAVRRGPSVASFLVPSPLAPGSYDLTAVGIATGPGYLEGIPDGSGRLARVRTGASGSMDGTDTVTDVLDGAAILAVGAGGDASPVPPDATAPGIPVVVAAFGAADAPGAVIVARPVGDAVEIRVLDGAKTLVLTTRPVPFRANPDDPVGSVEAQSGPSGRFVTLTHTDTSGSTTYRWALDGRCGPPPAPPTTSPPATPIPADAVFTG